MSTLYAETSAVLRWLLNDPDGDVARREIDAHESVLASVLTSVEVERALVRARRDGLLSEADSRKLIGDYRSASRGWTFVEISETVRTRAAAEFPVEPVRTLDAVHLASALELLAVHPDLEVLTFDTRILDNLRPLGLKPATRS